MFLVFFCRSFHVEPATMKELKKLKVCKCEEWEGMFCEESLKNFSPSSSSSSSNVCFPKLKEIQIWHCNKMKRLVDGDGDEEAQHGDRPLLLKLKELTLAKLPK
ncbi:uncharacterized protein LOC129317858 [Prosopis cineraria]|uniref:uncharacterized protein LOC129317858 n=1 Tax=Prosopis cineraria TaxID=364024 RepID=UPI00240F5589|nr:uncharacterized protein LOC129317858 [Prosopis cineraria]